MKRKVLSTLLVSMLLLSATACGNSGTSPSSGNSNTANAAVANSANQTEYVSDKEIEFVVSELEFSGKYSGDWKGGKANGSGVFVMEEEEGTVYIDGQFKNGEPSDVSMTINYENGSTAIYDGEIVNGMKNGTNVYWKFSDDEKTVCYQGGIKYDKFDGEGIYEKEANNQYFKYTGTFSNGSFIDGTYIYQDSNGNTETGKVINGETKSDSEIAEEKALDSIFGTIADHYGYGDLYDGVKGLFE